jgi:uncharacterized coiled-coil DUF342 family protein
VPLKRAAESTGRAAGAIERFIERTLAPRLEELVGEIRGLRGELGQFDKRMTENAASLRSEIGSLRNETIVRMDSLRTDVNSRFEAVNARIDGLSERLDARINALGERLDARIGALGERLDTRIDALSQRLDDALNIRERLVA